MRRGPQARRNRPSPHRGAPGAPADAALGIWWSAGTQVAGLGAEAIRPAGRPEGPGRARECLRGGGRRPRRSPVLLGLWLVSLSLWGSGCVKPIGYPPNVFLLNQLSLDEARAQLRLTLLRALNPHIEEVTITDEFLTYRIYPTPVVIRLFWGKIGGVEVFTNHVAFVQADEGAVLAQLVFPTEADATYFADLVMSLRDAYWAQQRQRRLPSISGQP